VVLSTCCMVLPYHRCFDFTATDICSLRDALYTGDHVLAHDELAQHQPEGYSSFVSVAVGRTDGPKWIGWQNLSLSWQEFLHFSYSHGPSANLLELCRLCMVFKPLGLTEVS